MSESQKPVAATVQEIKRKFPKSKSDFIIKCMEKEMAMEDVATAAMEETMMENETLSAKVQAMEEELKALKANAMEVEVEEDDDVEQVAKAKAKAKAKATGVQPVARATTSDVTAQAKWKSEVASRIKAGMSRERAIVAVERECPGLRQRMLEEAKLVRSV